MIYIPCEDETLAKYLFTVIKNHFGEEDVRITPTLQRGYFIYIHGDWTPILPAQASIKVVGNKIKSLEGLSDNTDYLSKYKEHTANKIFKELSEI